MFRREVIILALLFTAPLVWQALVEESVSWETVGIRYLIALPVAAILIGLVRLAARPRPTPDESGTDAGNGPVPASAPPPAPAEPPQSPRPGDTGAHAPRAP